MLTEREAWQKIYDAFERYANGEFNRLTAEGICGAMYKLGVEEEMMLPVTYVGMNTVLHIALRNEGFNPIALCWPTTPLGAAARCEFIRKHFLPAGCPQTCEGSVLTFEPHHKPAVNP